MMPVAFPDNAGILQLYVFNMLIIHALRLNIKCMPGKLHADKLFITGVPLIGEGNVIDIKSFIAVLERAGISGIDFYPNGPLVRLGRQFHEGMSMSTAKTMDYAFNSEISRDSLKVLPMKWELRLAIRKVYRAHANAVCFITSQNMIAEESVGNIGNIPTLVCSSDVTGKFSHYSRPSERQQKIIYLVWNREALSLYKNGLNLQNVHLIRPVDPINAFKLIEKSELPFQYARKEPDICFIKLSGSGGEPGFVNKAIISLWEKSRIRSIVFPGTEKTQKRIIKTVGENIDVCSSLDPSDYYGHAREIISDKQMVLTYPSEQVKHIAILTQHNIFPKVVWLPPRGQHEMINLSWAIKKGFSGTVCIPTEYRRKLKSRMTDLDVDPSDIEFSGPEELSGEHFRPSPLWQVEAEADAFENSVRNVTNLS